jgi:AcrR family transcriptional regulator
MQRDRAQTEKRLIEAVGQLIAENGFDQLGINRVASRAGINKVLIYRYFGGLGGLIEAYFERSPPVESAPLPDIEQLKDASLDEIFNACYDFLITEFRIARNSTEAGELLKATLLNSQGLYHPAAAEKESRLQQLVEELSGIINTGDGRSFAAIVVGGMSLLTLLSQQKRTIFGIDLSTEEGWSQIEAAAKSIYRGAYLLSRERLNNRGEEPV